MKSLSEQLDQYENQQDSSSRLTHLIGAPALLISLLLFFSWISISVFSQWHFTFAWFGAVALIIYYFMLDKKLGALMAVVLIILTLLCSWIAYPAPSKFSFILFLVLLIAGVVLEFIDNKVRSTPQAYCKQLCRLLIAPLFIVIELLKLLHLEKHFDLNQEKAQEPTEDE